MRRLIRKAVDALSAPIGRLAVTPSAEGILSGSCQVVAAAATIIFMPKRIAEKRQRSSGARGEDLPFHTGSLVIVTLGNPRDKFWGLVLDLAAEGLSLCGAELASFDDMVVIVKDGEPFTPAVVFFPMHRIERIELDLPAGNLPSLSQRFSSKTGRKAQDALSGFEKASE